MKVIPTKIPDVLIIEPKIFEDERGYFFESFNQKSFNDATGLDVAFVQDNHSKSARHVLRGLHYQLPPKAQGKLVRVIYGEVLDVAVDIRLGSLSYGQWVSITLSAKNKKQIWIPPGFAHGFLTLSETAEVLYKTTDYYTPELERCVAWNDPAFNVQWPIACVPILSYRDKLFSMP